MSLSDQENYDQPAKRRKRSNRTKPFALSQQVAMDSSSTSTVATPSKRLASTPVGGVVAKRARSQPSSQFVVYPDDEEASKFSRSSAGVIMSIKLINFMCHSHFEIKLNPRINFISGSNGSGKSAIQTAMVVGLGGVASKTNRSSRLDGLIKHGSQSGSIVITLSNHGWNAYKPDEFGDSITIVRNISQSSSNYKVYNHEGRLMANTKKEIDAICSKFRIQPNNPVAILNQDMARNFLSSNKAEDKYSLFRKAILLDEAEVVLDQLSLHIADQEDQLESKKRAITQIEEEVAKMSEKMKMVEQLRVSKEQKFALENELMWCKVNRSKEEMERLTSRREDQVARKEKLQAELNQLQNEERDLLERKEKFEADIANMRAECQTKEDMKRQLAADVRKLMNLFNEKCGECDSFISNFVARKKDYAELKRSLDDTQRMDMEQREKKELANRKMTVLKEELDVNESKLVVLSGELSRVQKNMEAYNDKMNRLKRSMQDMRENIERCQHQIRSIGGKSDSLSMYEPWMQTLVQKIEEAVRRNKFSKPPLGPLGRYITVQDQQWIYAIESNLSVGLLSSFLVNEGNDRKVLYSIMEQVIRSGSKPMVHCSRFQEQDRGHDIRNMETTHPNYTNMLRALSVDNVVVSNFLMDYRHIHQILLVSNDEDCRRFVEKDSNIPRNCELILNTDADQFCAGYKVHANFSKNRRARILRKSVADHISGLREEVAEKQAKIKESTAELESIRKERAQQESQYREMNRDIASLKSTIIRAKGEMKEFRNVIEMEVPTLQMKLDEIKELEIELQQMEERKQTLIDERSKAQKDMEEKKQQQSVVAQDDSVSLQTQLNHDREKTERELRLLNEKISVWRNNISEQNKKLSKLDERIAEATRNLTEEEATASQMTEEVETRRSITEVQRELEEVENFIETAKKKLGAETNKFQSNFFDKKDNLKKQVNYYHDLRNILKESKELYGDRKNRIGRIRDTNAIVIMTQFQSVLRSRNYKGDLRFNHGSRKLDIMMAPIDGGDTLMNTSSLSGGEKSYSTVAFLLALWSNMELPFYSMDEYDVFMDAINRKTITKLLMSFAKNKENRQFIFLTPLDVSIIQISDYVQVHKVKKIET